MIELINTPAGAAILSAVLSAVVAVILTYFTSRGHLSSQLRESETRLKECTSSLQTAKTQNKSLTDEANRLRQRTKSLELVEVAFNNTKKALGRATIITTFSQPVLLIGPRFAGKTSLLLQWHAPWSHDPTERTSRDRVARVPIYSYQDQNLIPHYACPGVSARHQINLELKVLDFPGELDSQSSIRARALEETEQLRKATGKDLGIVLACLFDAEESVKGISSRTYDYYTGDLFSQLRRLVAENRIEISRVLLVFNKIDRLAAATSIPVNDDVLLKRSVAAFTEVYAPLRSICAQEKFCAIPTILDREQMSTNNMGSIIVKGEAARGFVEAIAGRTAAAQVISYAAADVSSSYFEDRP